MDGSKTDDGANSTQVHSWRVSTALLMVLILRVHAFGLLGGLMHFVDDALLVIRMICTLLPTIALEIGAELHEPDSPGRILYSSLAFAFLWGMMTYFITRLAITLMRRNNADPSLYQHVDVTIGFIAVCIIFCYMQVKSGRWFGRDEIAVLQNIPDQISWFARNLADKGPGLLSDWSQMKYSELKMRYRGFDIARIMDADL